MTNPQIKIEGFLAYFDLLGFSNRIAEKGFEDKFDQYYKIINGAVSRFPDIEYKFFSDSVVIYTKNMSEYSFADLLRVISRVFFSLVTMMSLSLCGAISCGAFFIHERKGNVMISGNPMVDAVQWEVKQDWIGIMISPDVIKQMDIFKSLINKDYSALNPDELYSNKTAFWLAHLFKYDTIPIKNNDPRKGFCIIPHNGATDYAQLKYHLIEFKNKLAVMNYTVPDSHVQNKFKSTNDMLNSLLNKLEPFSDDIKM